MRRFATLVTTCVALASSQAMAQEEPPEAPPAEEGRAEKTKEEQTKEKTEEKKESATKESAAEAFARATDLFNKNSYAEAIKAFGRAYELKPHFMVQCSIARCHEILNDMIKAAEHYRRCLEEGAKDAPNADQVRETLKDVEAKITRVQVDSTGKGGTVYVDGRAVGTAPQRVTLNPGSHVIEVRRTGATPASASVEAKGGEQTVSLTPMDLRPDKPGPAPPGPERPGLFQAWFWIAAATTAVFATTAIILGARTLGLQSDYEEEPTKEGLDSFKSSRAATNVMWGLTAVAAAGSTVLFFYTDFGGQGSGPVTKEKSAMTLGVGVRGTF